MEAKRPMDNDDQPSAGEDAAVEARRVARFLEANPGWLATQTGLYERLSPPKRVHGDALADHMAAMIEAARLHSRTVLDANRAALGLTERVRAAVLALIRTPDLADWIAVELPRLLGLDAARLCIETSPSLGPSLGAMLPALGAATVPPGTSARLLGHRDVSLRRNAWPGDALLLHGEAAGLAVHDAMLRVQAAGAPPMLLALAMRDAAILEGAGSETALAFLGASLAARIERP
jgi:hypothetical protein